MVRETCRVVGNRVPVLAGITDSALVESLEFGNTCANAGISGLVAAPPYYFRMAQSDLLRHAESACDGTAAPIYPAITSPD